MSKPFVLIKNKDTFKKELEEGNIASSSISFIEDTGEIWTQGSYYTGSTSGTSNHVFMSEVAYKALDTIDSDVLYCLYEQDTEQVQVPLPSSITILEGQLPYAPSNTTYYKVLGDTLTSKEQSPVIWTAILKDTVNSIWADNTISNKTFTVTVVGTSWTFGDSFPVTLS